MEGKTLWTPNSLPVLLNTWDEPSPKRTLYTIYSTFNIEVNFFSHSFTVSSNQMRGEYFYPVPASNLVTPMQVCSSKTILFIPRIRQSLM